MSKENLEKRLSEYAMLLGIGTSRMFNPGLLIPEQRIRDYCFENECGNFRNNYMCPPHVGTLDETRDRLDRFKKGALFQYSQPVDVKNNRRGVTQIKVDFHKKILKIENFLKDEGLSEVWGMIGGSCQLCDACKAIAKEPCPYPDKARMSLESMAIDVLALLARFNLDNRFHPDRITWTGCVLF